MPDKADIEPLQDEEFLYAQKMQENLARKSQDSFWLVLFTTDTNQPTTIEHPFPTRESAEAYARNNYSSLRYFVGTRADIAQFNERLARLKRIEQRTEQITTGTAKLARGFKKGFLEPDKGSKQKTPNPYEVGHPRQAWGFPQQHDLPGYNQPRWGPVPRTPTKQPTKAPMGYQPQGFMFLSNEEMRRGLGRKTGKGVKK